jgi:hypothetical protein
MSSAFFRADPCIPWLKTLKKTLTTENTELHGKGPKTIGLRWAGGAALRNFLVLACGCGLMNA